MLQSFTLQQRVLLDFLLLMGECATRVARVSSFHYLQAIRFPAASWEGVLRRLSAYFEHSRHALSNGIRNPYAQTKGNPFTHATP